MEVASFLHDESWTDRAGHIDPWMRGLAIGLNDRLPDEVRQGLLAFAPRLNQAMASLPERERAGAWLRVAVRALQAWLVHKRLGCAAVDELAESMQQFVENPSTLGYPYQLLVETVERGWHKGFEEHASRLAQAMAAYEEGAYAGACEKAGLLVWNALSIQAIGAVPLAGPWQLDTFAELLDVYEGAAGLGSPTLADVPAASWERMHRAMFALAA